MNILWLRPSRGENISVRRERIAAELRTRGYKIDICDTSGTDIIGAIKVALTGDYDIIVGNVRVGLYIGFPVSKLLGKPFLGDVSDPISDIDDYPELLFRFFEWYEWQTLKRADAAVFVYRSSYQEALARGVTNAHRLPNAVDYDSFASPDPNTVEETDRILQEVGVDTEKPIAIYLGVLASHYKIEEILETASKAPDWEFVFIGEGELTGEVKQVAKNSENIYYPGSFEYRLMPGFLAHATVGFCFKDAEQPLKLKEYGAAGLPVIVRPGELSRFHDDDELVFVDPVPSEIANRLEQLRTDETLREQYVEAGRSIAAEWSWEEIAHAYDRLFQNMQ